MYLESRKNAKIFTLFLCMGLGTILLLDAQEKVSKDKLNKFETGHQKLEEVRQWFWENPPNGRNRMERQRRMDVIQSACDQLAPSDYEDYFRCWKTDESAATTAEEQHPGLYYLRKATSHALTDIHNTKVKQGLAVWYIYNMGYIFKTPDACFGIDIHMRDSDLLSDVLDFLLITHEHNDHWVSALIDAMVAVNKPVITRWRTGTTIINEPSECRFGSCRIKVDIGDHHIEQPDKQNDMLMFQVDCGENANNYTIYHSGDGSNFLKMCPDKKIDIFIVHVQVGMSVEDAINHLKPRLTFVSHVMELGHSPKPPNAWRWSFEYAYDRIKNIPIDKAVVLTWGERWLMSGTILEHISE
jgi:hypothetical protein